MFTPEQKAKFLNPSVPVFMTSQEGEALATAGLIVADPSQKDPSNQNAFLVTLTPAGQAQLSAPPAAPLTPAPPMMPAAPAVPPTAPVAQATTQAGVGYDSVQGDNISPVESGFTPAPAKKRGGSSSNTRKSAYNYDGLQAPETKEDGTVAYQSFHVAPKKDETVEALLKRMSSNTSAANRRYRDYVTDENGQTVMEEYDKRTFARDAEGGYVKDAEGKRVSTVEKKTRPKTVPTRKFIVQEAQEGDPKGAGVRVFRVNLS